MKDFAHIRTLCNRQVLFVRDDDNEDEEYPWKLTISFLLPNGVKVTSAMKFADEDEKLRDTAFKAAVKGLMDSSISGTIKGTDRQFGKKEHVTPIKAKPRKSKK